jgi:hypothetical protein
MAPTAEGQRYVPEVFTRIADSQTLDAVAAWLSKQTGRTFHPRVIAAMIRNTSYMGQRRDASGTIVHTFPELVSGDLWRRANANLDARPSARRGQRNDLTTGAALLSGLVFCGNPSCSAGPDSPMYKILSQRGTERIAYLRCSGRGAQRKGCGCMVPMADADALMNWNMNQLILPVLRPVPHPATGHQVELDDVNQALRDLPAQGLDDDAEDDERARLRSERKRLQDLPAKPAWTEFVPVLGDDGEPLLYGDKWKNSDQAERRRWLKDDAGFRAYLGKPGMVAPADDGPEDEAFHRVESYQTDRAVLTFQWRDDDDPGFTRGLT